ncbi:longitudinals lacking protein-like [Vespula squamosa]|uniref:Longitudinals lacking protein-like n=1 Tax=Vespula squamosa TaxID=30214 RepID=A0ABD2A274_VESSQ
MDDLLKRHLRALGYISCQKVTYPCKNCGKVYHYYSSLARHLKHECGVEPKFHCPLCPYRTKHKSSLNTHLNGRHMKLLNEFYALPNGNKLSSSMNATN